MSRHAGLYRFLDLNGDGTGSKSMAVDGTTPKVFKIRPPEGEVYQIERMLVHIHSTATGFAADKYGNIDVLTAGVGMKLEIRDASDDSVLQDLLDGLTIKSNSDWARHCYDSMPFEYGAGVNDKFVAVRWTFSKSGQPLTLSRGQYLAFVISDNLATLTDHNAMVQGTIYDN